MKISVIVSTYNTPLFLTAVLTTLARQTDSNFEVLIADDGSTHQTAAVIAEFQSHLAAPLKHIWQADDGFRAAQIRNKAIAAATGDYIIFIDGDCLLRQDFIAKHRALARPHWFVAGNRILINQTLTAQLLQKPTEIPKLTLRQSLLWWTQRKINRWLSLWYLPLGPLRRCAAKNLRGIKTCNLAVWTSDLYTINGFDESYVGWGYEDSDLAIRLMHAGVFRQSGRFATTVFHLWHPVNDRSKENRNLEKLKNCIGEKKVFAAAGLNQYK